MKPALVLTVGGAWLLAALTLAGLAQAQSSPSQVAFSEQWTATDALGRALPSPEEAGPPRSDRYIGVFYWLWHGYTRTNPIRDVTQTLKANPTSPTWYYQDYFWGQPEAGYYHSSDAWVARRNLQMLADAGVDFIFFDFTNGPLGKESLDGFLDVAEDMKAAGVPVPYFVFFLNSAGAETLDWLYANLYAPGKYRDLWFQWQSKPLLMADPAFATNSEIANFFTFRRTWAFQTGEQDQWRFIDNYPQRASWHSAPDKPEQICVSKSMGAPLVPKGNVDDKGSSFHAGMEAVYDQYWLTSDTPKGLYFDEQWQHALEVDPEIVLVSGWNELTAGAWTADSGMAGNYSFMGRELKTGDYYFVDEFNEEFNRDLEPMSGGYTDNYYYQLVGYARRFKGMHPREPASAPTSVQIDGSFADWREVRPIYRDAPGDTAHRNYRNTDGSATLSNDTGRNDLVESRAAHDASTVFFYAKTAAPLSPATDPSWMLLFIDSDQDKATGFEGYDYLVGSGGAVQGERPLLRWATAAWQPAGSVRVAFAGAELELSIAKSLLGVSSAAPRFDFHWADNIQGLTDVTEFFINGDSAPDRRFAFRYDAEPVALGGTAAGGSAAGGATGSSGGGGAGSGAVSGAESGGSGPGSAPVPAGQSGADGQHPTIEPSCACGTSPHPTRSQWWLSFAIALGLAARRRLTRRSLALSFAALASISCGNGTSPIAGAAGLGGMLSAGAAAGSGGQGGSRAGTAGGGSAGAAVAGAAVAGETGEAGDGGSAAEVDACAGEQGAKHFAVGDFGAIGDGVTDDMPAFERAVLAVRQHAGPSVVELGEAQSYRLVSAAHPQWQTFEFALDLPSHTVVDGHGSTLLLGPDARALWLEGVDSVAVCRVDIDYSPLPFTQGAVTTVDAANGSFDLSIANEFDVPPDVTDPPANPPFFAKVLHEDGSFPHLFVRKLQRLTAGDRVARVFPSDAAAVSGIVAGEIVVLPVFGVGQRDPETIHVFHSGDVTLQDVRVFSAPLFTTSLRENHGPLTFERVEVRPKPGSTRLISSWRDAFHVKDNRAALLFDACYVERSQDDAFNVSGMWLRIASSTSNQDVTVQSPYGGVLPEVGDRVQVYDAQTGRIVGETTVASRDVAKKTLVFATALDGLAAGQQLISLDACNPGTIIRNSTVIGTGMRLRSALMFEGNTVSGGEVLISSENDVEGPVPRGLVLRGNSFDGPFLALSVELQLAGAGPAARSISGITLENNVFKHLLQIHDADGIDFTGNDFQTDAAGSWLDLANDRNIRAPGTLHQGQPFATLASKVGVGPNMQASDVSY